jgi:hypothetical protein
MPPAESSFDEVEVLEPQARVLQRLRSTQPGLSSREADRPLVQYGPDAFTLILAEGDLVVAEQAWTGDPRRRVCGLASQRVRVASTAIRRVAERQMAETAT